MRRVHDEPLRIGETCSVYFLVMIQQKPDV
jgi:hypothetical protein